MNGIELALAEGREAIRRLNRAAKGDSNDAEIEAGHGVAEAYDHLAAATSELVKAARELLRDWDGVMPLRLAQSPKAILATDEEVVSGPASFFSRPRAGGSRRSPTPATPGSRRLPLTSKPGRSQQR